MHGRIILNKLYNKLDKLFFIFDYIVLIFLFSGFFILDSKNSFYKLLLNGTESTLYEIIIPITILYMLLAFVLFLILKKLYDYGTYKDRVRNICIYIFFISFILRFIVINMGFYIPINDFSRYYELGINAYYGNYNEISSIVSSYHIPTFGGLALINGFIMRIFSTSVYGMQIANCIINSLSCVILFIIFKDKDIKIGAIAGFLYALYPANIFSTTVTTNTHGSILFNLLAVLLAINAYKNLSNYENNDSA